MMSFRTSMPFEGLVFKSADTDSKSGSHIPFGSEKKTLISNK